VRIFHAAPNNAATIFPANADFSAIAFKIIPTVDDIADHTNIVALAMIDVNVS
jgi:hypothetical protein